MSSPSSHQASYVSEQQKEQFKKEGYFILENVVPPEHLEMMRREAAFAIERTDREMDRQKVDVLGPNYRGRRYFASDVWKERPVLRTFLFSDLMADICRATIGPEANLFYEQYVIKCADKGMTFSWHQDSGYVGSDHTPYLTCWITLDDVNEANGTVYLLPYSQLGIRTLVKHVRVPEQNNDLVGYFGSLRGIPVIAPAGSIACFTSLVFHCSGANTTPHMRRIYLAQYATEVIHSPDGQAMANAEPFLRAGQNVAKTA